MKTIYTTQLLKKITTLLLLVLALTGVTKAQDMTAYNLGGVPQTYMLNPAFQPECNIYLGAPGLGHFNVNAFNSDIHLQDIFWADPETDSVIHPWHPNANKQEFLDKLSDYNITRIKHSMALASFGFRVQEMYFHFSAIQKEDLTLTLPKDVFAATLDKNIRTGYDFSGLEANASAYMEVAVGVSRNFGDFLQVGIRPKMYLGQGIVKGRFDNYNIGVSKDEITFDGNAQVYSAGPGFAIPVTQGDMDLDSSITELTENPGEIPSRLTGNRGLGIDIGVNYKPIDNLDVYASVIDLGYINWKKYTSVAKGSFSDSYLGFDLNDSTDGGGDSELLDSAFFSDDIPVTNEAFKTNMTPSIYVGGEYAVTSSISLGALYKGTIYTDNMLHDLALTANLRPSKIFNVSATYQPLDRVKNKFGLGFSIRLGPLSMYWITDDISLTFYDMKGLTIPATQNNYNIRFGLNLLFGCNKNKKLMKDKPLMYSGNNY